MKFQFKKGDIVSFYQRTSRLNAAKRGACAIVIGFVKSSPEFGNKFWLDVKWLRSDHRVNGQMDGDYYISDFRLTSKAKAMAKIV